MGSRNYVGIIVALAGLAVASCKGADKQEASTAEQDKQLEVATAPPQDPVVADPAPDSEGNGEAEEPEEGGGTVNEDFPGSFESQNEGAEPEGFTQGHNKVGNPCTWTVIEDDTAPIGSLVVAQQNAEGPKTRFCTLAEEGVSVADVEASVHCKPVSGELDQSCGLVFRYTDEDNYYVARANAREQNVRLYKVVASVRSPIGEWAGSTPLGEWSTLAVKAKGTHYTVIWNDETVLELDDDTFPGAGSVGVWTKGDAVTHFDGLLYDSLKE